MAGTWGESESPRDGRNSAQQAEVLTELEATAALGVDMLLIDDAWQVGRDADGWVPDGGAGWWPHLGIYPDGWRRVRERAQALGVRLGLWGVAQHISLEDMVWNQEQLGMEQFKLDFAALRSHLDRLMRKVRAFMERPGHRCIVSWDTTENAPRYGYFWAREYGNVHFMNRKPRRPPAPLTGVFRGHGADGGAAVHGPPAAPQPRRPRARRGAPGGPPGAPATDLGPPRLSHRRGPSNAGWCGFQAWCGDGGGYLTVFLNGERSRSIGLRRVAEGTRLQVTDPIRGREWTVVAGADGSIGLEMEEPGAFRSLTV